MEDSRGPWHGPAAGGVGFEGREPLTPTESANHRLCSWHYQQQRLGRSLVGRVFAWHARGSHPSTPNHRRNLRCSCCLRQRWLSQTWGPGQSPGCFPCHSRKTSSGAGRSGKHTCGCQWAQPFLLAPSFREVMPTGACTSFWSFREIPFFDPVGGLLEALNQEDTGLGV